MRIELCLIGAALAHELPKQDNGLPIPIKNVPDFIGGLFFGLAKKNKLREITKCIKDSKHLLGEVQIAVGDFKKKTIPDIIAGVEEVGVIIQELPNDLIDCVSIKDDIQKIEKWAQIFKEPPMDLAKMLTINLGAHWDRVMSDIDKVTDTDIAAKKFYKMGIDTSDIITMLLGHPKASIDDDMTYSEWQVYRHRIDNNMEPLTEETTFLY